ELGAKLDRPRLLDVEGVVVEEDFFEVGPVFLHLGHLGGDAIGRTLAPGMSAERLRPQAEGALRRASARGVEREIRIEQEGNVVAADIEVALVDVDDVGHGVEVFDRGAIGRVQYLAAGVAIADAEDVLQRPAVGELDAGEIELAAYDEIDGGALVERAD